ncbi:DMT family transporter [Pontivivens nitratireducens]|uniref:DMT family transporter n=1 Tax=Pontivivens nitratireducens TaxID=2758038 RepID=UPI001639D436|nr:DMT family transporter [Pontibrevibacter nitratireducens]
MGNLTERQRGLTMAFIGIMVLMPDTILFRLIDTNLWTLMIWRAGFQGAVLWVALLLLRGRKLPEDVRTLGWPGAGFTLAMGVAAVCFNLAIAWTTVANTLFILAAMPLWAALLSWLMMGERIDLRMGLTIMAAMIGIGILVTGNDEGGVAHWSGDLAALGGSFTMAAGFSLARFAPGRSMVPALAGSTVVPVAFGIAMGGLALPLQGDMGFLFVMGAIIAPLSFALISSAPRYIPSTEVSLIMLLETALAPILVWWIVGEDPGPRAILGGVIVVAALLVSNLVGLRRIRA